MAAKGGKSAGIGVPGFVPKWRWGQSSAYLSPGPHNIQVIGRWPALEGDPELGEVGLVDEPFARELQLELSALGLGPVGELIAALAAGAFAEPLQSGPGRTEVHSELAARDTLSIQLRVDRGGEGAWRSA